MKLAVKTIKFWSKLNLFCIALWVKKIGIRCRMPLERQAELRGKVLATPFCHWKRSKFDHQSGKTKIRKITAANQGAGHESPSKCEKLDGGQAIDTVWWVSICFANFVLNLITVFFRQSPGIVNLTVSVYHDRSADLLVRLLTVLPNIQPRVPADFLLEFIGRFIGDKLGGIVAVVDGLKRACFVGSIEIQFKLSRLSR